MEFKSSPLIASNFDILETGIIERLGRSKTAEVLTKILSKFWWKIEGLGFWSPDRLKCVCEELWLELGLTGSLFWSNPETKEFSTATLYREKCINRGLSKINKLAYLK